MIADWFAHGGLFALAAAVVYVPGLVIGAGLRLRGLALAGLAPGITIGLYAVLAIGFGFAGIRWGLVSVAVATLVIAVIAFVVGRLVPKPRPSVAARGSRALLVTGLIVGGGLIAARLMTYIGVPWAISQTNDAIFHLNALRWIAETGSASSVTLGGVVGGPTFYPGAWHAIASLVALSPGDIPVAVNMVALVIGAGVWPIGIALLTRVVTRDAVAAVVAPALAAGLLAFPQLMFEWGVLYPYALSLALVPPAVAGTMLVHRMWRDAAPGARVRSVLGMLIAAGCAVVAIALSQPASLLVWGLLSAAWATGILVGVIRRDASVRPRRGRGIAIAVLCAIWIVLGLVWLAFAVALGPVLWDPYLSVLGALRDVVLNSQGALPAALGVSILMVMGIVVAIRSRRLRWLAISWAVFALLYIVAVATHLPVVKRALTGAWYGDSYRLAAIAPIVVVPLAALGLAVVLRWFATSIRSDRARDQAPWWAMGVIAVVGVVGLIVAPVVQLRVAHTTDEQSRYALNDRSNLTRDAFELLRRLPQALPEDALLIGNPSTAVGLAYALGERDVIPRTWSPPATDAWNVLAADLREAGTDPAVCEALALYGDPGYVLDFGPGEASPGRYVMPGMTDFEGQPGFELVDEEGEASLWRITACR